MTETSVKTEDDAPKSFAEKLKQEAREWGIVLAWFIPIYLLFTGLVYEQRVIPSESMVPNLQVGDRVAVNKFAYGYTRHSIPFSWGRYLPIPEGRIFASAPERGDVAVFEHPHHPRVMIKRVIGLPGDRVQMIGEQMYLNDEPVPTEFVGRKRLIRHDDGQIVTVREFIETYGDKSFAVHQWENWPRIDDTGVFVVPDGHILFIGDNRDNSKDGRDTSGHCRAASGVISEAGCAPLGDPERASVGFVPMDHLIGRADTVLFTTNRCKKQAGVDCPPKRLWKGL